MQTRGVGPDLPIDPIKFRAANVENPDLIRGLSKGILGPSTKAVQDYTQNVKGYADDVSDRVVWMRGGGKKGEGTNTATTTSILARKNPFTNPRNPVAVIHPKRVSSTHRH